VTERVIPQIRSDDAGECAAERPTSRGTRTSCRIGQGRGSMAIPGTHLVRAAVGRRGKVTQERAGRAALALRKSGVGDLEEAGRRGGVHRAHQARPSFMPADCEKPAPILPGLRSGGAHGRGAARRAAGVQPQSPMTCTRVIGRIVDGRLNST